MQPKIAYVGVVVIGIACAVGFTIYKMDNKPAWLDSLIGDAKADQAILPATEASTEATPAAPAAATDADKEMLEYMIFSVGDLVSKQASQPMWREEARDMRNRIEEYYKHLKASQASPTLCVKLGLFLANATRDLAAYDKAFEGYNAVLADWNNLPESERTSIEGRRMRSAIANGLGSCLLARGKAADALPYYEEALELDHKLFDELAPENHAELPAGSNISPDLIRAAEDVLSSYRCLGECQFAADDPEEARDTYRKGHELAMRMKNLKPGMSIQYIRLLSAMGNLESNCGVPKKAYAAWMNAATTAQRLRKSSPSPAIQAQTARFLRELENSLKTVNKQLRDEAAAQQQDPAAPQQ